MRLGTLELSRREVDDFTAATLLRAYRGSTEPDRSLVLLAALGICVHGPADWPTMRPGIDYAGHGGMVRAYLIARGAPLKGALAAGYMAVEAIARQPGVTDAEVEEYADFFGVTLAGSPGAASHTATSGTPSEG